MAKPSTRGFTLLEVLVVLMIVALSLSVVFPEMFPELGVNEQRRTVMKIVEKINAYHWKAFKEKKLIFVSEDKGVLTVKTDGKTKKIWSSNGDTTLAMSDTLVCMPNGAVNGATMRVDFKSSLFYVVFTPFDGETFITEGK